MRQYMPWQIKIAAKIVLSRFPAGYRFWSNIGLFKLGQMADPGYALKIFFFHHDRVFSASSAKDKVFLEMGPGDSVAAAVCAASVGAKKIYLADIGDYATRDMQVYRRIADALRVRGLHPPEIPAGMTFGDLLRICNAEYLTDGSASLQKIPNGSIDYAWSHSMMEHVRKHDFKDTVKEHYRIMKPDGVISHSIDLQDHLGGKLNNLRFSEEVWESDFMVKSGFYTNRLRASEILKCFQNAGFTFKSKEAGVWTEIPTPRHAMNAMFRNCDESDLLTRSLSVILKK